MSLNILVHENNALVVNVQLKKKKQKQKEEWLDLNGIGEPLVLGTRELKHKGKNYHHGKYSVRWIHTPNAYADFHP